MAEAPNRDARGSVQVQSLQLQQNLKEYPKGVQIGWGRNEDSLEASPGVVGAFRCGPGGPTVRHRPTQKFRLPRPSSDGSTGLSGDDTYLFSLPTAAVK